MSGFDFRSRGPVFKSRSVTFLDDRVSVLFETPSSPSPRRKKSEIKDLGKISTVREL